MNSEVYKYADKTAKIIGTAIEVHKILGNGFQEVIYQRALEIELTNIQMPFEREYVMPIFYKGIQIGTRRVDFLIDNIISVEMKAMTELTKVHYAQAINYLEAYNLEIGVLLNFGSTSLEIKRLINKKFNPTTRTKFQKQGINLIGTYSKSNPPTPLANLFIKALTFLKSTYMVFKKILKTS